MAPAVGADCGGCVHSGRSSKDVIIVTLGILIIIDTVCLVVGVLTAGVVSLVVIHLLRAMVASTQRIADQTGEIVTHQANLDARVAQATIIPPVG
jgi:hypothetical protein